jgi:type IV pilus assembly protein PilY1
MDWDYLPDWAGPRGRLNQSKNPASTASPTTRRSPIWHRSISTPTAQPDTTTYPSQTSAATTAWTSVKDDGYGVQSAGISNLIGNAYYFTTVAGEYCTNQSMKTCVAATAKRDLPVPAYCAGAARPPMPSPRRPADGACQATQIDPNPPPATPTNIPFNFPRMPAPRASTSPSAAAAAPRSAASPSAPADPLGGNAATSSSPATLAIDIESAINACTFGPSVSDCQVVGYRAVAVGQTP